MKLVHVLVSSLLALSVAAAAPVPWSGKKNHSEAYAQAVVQGRQPAPESVRWDQETVSRSEFLSSLIREAGLSLDGIYFIKPPVVGDIAPDVRDGAPYARDLVIAGHYGIIDTLEYAGAVQDAVKLGFLEHDGRFRPGDALAREEALKLLKVFGEAAGGWKNPDGVTYSLPGDRKSITLYWGEKPTGGYAVKIRSVALEGDVLKVFYSLRSPRPGEMVTQAVTYPRDTAPLPAESGSFTRVQLVRWVEDAGIIFYIGRNTYSADGRAMTMDAVPFLENGRAYLPVRYLAMALGVPEDRISWSPSARTVTLVKGGVTVSLAAGGPIMYINDRPVNMDAVPLLREGRVYLPAGFIAEALGYRVDWDLYPEKEAPRIRDLDAGKVVRVDQEYGGWRYVRIVVYDIPAVQRGWVRGEYLAAPGQAAPQEGKIPAGTMVYPGDPNAENVRDENSSRRTPARLDLPGLSFWPVLPPQDKGPPGNSLP